MAAPKVQGARYEEQVQNNSCDATVLDTLHWRPQHHRPQAKMTPRQPMCKSTRYGSAFRPAVREINPRQLRALRCVHAAWLHMHMLRGRARHAKTPCPQPEATACTALCARYVAAYAYASGQGAPRKDALPHSCYFGSFFGNFGHFRLLRAIFRLLRELSAT